jgi:hypothetical protein
LHYYCILKASSNRTTGNYRFILSHWVFGGVRVAHLFFFCIHLLCVFAFWIPSCDARCDFRIKRCSVRIYLRLLVGSSCLIYVICLCLFKVLSNTYCVVFFVWLFVVLCTICCQILWIFYFFLPLRYSLAFIKLK